MPSDWLFYGMTRPAGLAVITAAVGLPFLLWRAVLASAFPRIGFAPLAAAYAAAALGLVALAATSSYVAFSARVASNLLPEAQRWPTVASWTLTACVLSAIVVLPLLGLVAVPASAWLLKTGRFTLRAIAGALVTLWLLLAVGVWAFPSNEWQRTHRLEAMSCWLSSLGLPIALVGLPFLLTLYALSRGPRSSAALGSAQGGPKGN